MRCGPTAPHHSASPRGDGERSGVREQAAADTIECELDGSTRQATSGADESSFVRNDLDIQAQFAPLSKSKLHDTDPPR
ncbi:hypothetical protein RGF97_07650 [Streptomyces roseicoloratus]|uniref:Transposase n=1 Tax=Streptomyces roseicoloratus TaxID=2508722 RepID=A0ABY9RRC9_9ACTN|nr:hypothetical protein [Streptomyces roseicoloratus]WMX44751.1 hypothetical protein RGF97_07650 [Streptomyces roseicoloratus]